LDEHPACVRERDDLSLERVTLLNQLGRHDEALQSLEGRNYHPWEGGEGNVSAQYVLALAELARRAIVDDRRQDAIAILERARQWPESIGEGKLVGIQENNIHYWLGEAYRRLGDKPLADKWFERAATGLAEPSSPQFYNDQPPDMIFYQGLAGRALGREAEAQERFQRLVDYGRSHLNDEAIIDFFAVSLPDFLVFDADLNVKHEVHCRYMLALGLIGLGNADEAERQFERIIALDRNHLGAIVHRQLVGITAGAVG
jgi:tetratricopeptide (TPR) repeat protein